MPRFAQGAPNEPHQVPAVRHQDIIGCAQFSSSLEEETKKYILSVLGNLTITNSGY